MGQNGLSPKKSPPCGERYEGEISFQSEEESVKEQFALSAGRTLLVFDGEDRAFAAAACNPKAIAVVFDGDCLPLFSMPDGVSRVLATGDEATLRAARYFSEIRGAACTLYPKHAALEGAFEAQGRGRLGGEVKKVPLTCDAEVVLDKEMLKESLPEGFARCLIARLAAIEGEALKELGGEKTTLQAEFPASIEAEEIVLANARQRKKEQAGFPVGEGKKLSELLKERGEKYPAWRAYLQLSALYAAFFEKGKPRRYFTPDYRKRAEEAGDAFFSVPSAEEYVLRAMALERIRSPFARASAALSDEREEFAKIMTALAGEPVSLKAGELRNLKILPERAPLGLSAVIRDFGLMEWEL